MWQNCKAGRNIKCVRHSGNQSGSIIQTNITTQQLYLVSVLLKINHNVYNHFIHSSLKLKTGQVLTNRRMITKYRIFTQWNTTQQINYRVKLQQWDASHRYYAKYNLYK